MGSYSIKELEIITGIKAHTIRIWEQRYHILSPGRSQTNIRSYTEDDLKHLLSVSQLNRNGYKISRIAGMTDKQLREKILDLCESNFEFRNQIDAMTVAMVEYDEESFLKLLIANIHRIGFEETFLNIIFPFLNRVGLLWQTAAIRPGQEHFISALIRQKMLAAIDRQVFAGAEDVRRYLLFLPERELHEHSLLFLNYIIRSRNNHSLYLGAGLPLEDLIFAVRDYRPDYLVTVCIAWPGEDKVGEYLGQIREQFPDTPLLVSGRQAQVPEAKIPADVQLFSTIQEAITFVEEHSAHGKPGREQHFLAAMNT